MQDNSTEHFFKSSVLGHPSALFVLFFTEMWERFSYYGMRAILVLFLISSLSDGGWAWSTENALALYGTYTGLVYITPILGGYIADKMIGYRAAVVLGAIIMTLGHASMAVETPMFLYIGIGCLIIGNGFFKPNITSIISNIYKNDEHKKDGAFTIFYMGVNAGAFLGIMLCGYLGEKVGWSWGFGLAGIFMFFGMLQFHFAKKIFGDVGGKPDAQSTLADAENIDNAVLNEEKTEDGEILDSAKNVSTELRKDKPNPFTLLDKILIVLSAAGGIIWILNDPISKIGGVDILDFTGNGQGSNYVIMASLGLFLFLVIGRLSRYTPVVRDKMIAVVIFAFFTVFFWAAFEQAGGSMAVFAENNTDRVLEGSWGFGFKIFNALLTVVPLGIITFVLVKLFKQTFNKIALSNIILGSSFVFIWAIVIWILGKEFSDEGTEIPASWFAILNSFFIIALAPLFSKWWESKYNPSGPVKYALGLILLGLGFGILAFGASAIPSGGEVQAALDSGIELEVVKVSMIWLVLAYLFHTLGELCLSPVGLSYVSKLVPARMIAFMFGVWYLAVAIGNKTAGLMGGMIEPIQEEYSMSTFFLIFTAVPIAVGLIAIILNPFIKRFMHGVK